MKKAFYSRSTYIDRIKPFMNSNLIKVIIGQRRVGKSYLLFELMDFIKKEHPKSDIIYINKEDFAFDHIKNYVDLMHHIEANRRNLSNRCYLFLDEIQDITEFERALRSLQTDDKYDIYCTGSNATMLSGELATYLSGRYIETRIYSLTYKEFLLFHKLKDTDESFTKYYKYGGLPHLTNLPLEDNIVYEYLRNIYNTIVLKDVIARYNIRSVRQLEDLIHYLADNIGNLFSATKISEYLKNQRIELIPKTILEYLNYLNNVFLISRVKQSDVQGKQHFQIGEKYYFEDLGLRHALIKYKPDDMNKVLENLVYHHLIVQGYKVAIGKLNTKEIDFIAEKNGEKIYIQVALTLMLESTQEREFGNLLDIKDNYPKFVVTLDTLEGASHQGIKQIPIRKFLMTF